MRPPGVGQPLVLELDPHGRLEGRVEHASGDRLVIATFVRLPAFPAALVGAPAQLGFVTERGRHLAPAVVLGAESAGLVEVALTGEVEVDQRRDHVRVGALLPGVVARLDAHGAQPPLHTYTLDVSGGGVLVAGTGPAQIGDAVDVTLKLPGGEPLRALGHIARRSREGHAGLTLDGLASRDREALVRFVFARQREERAAVREGR